MHVETAAWRELAPPAPAIPIALPENGAAACAHALYAFRSGVRPRALIAPAVPAIVRDVTRWNVWDSATGPVALAARQTHGSHRPHTQQARHPMSPTNLFYAK